MNRSQKILDCVLTSPYLLWSKQTCLLMLIVSNLGTHLAENFFILKWAVEIFCAHSVQIPIISRTFILRWFITKLCNFSIISEMVSSFGQQLFSHCLISKCLHCCKITNAHLFKWLTFKLNHAVPWKSDIIIVKSYVYENYHILNTSSAISGIGRCIFSGLVIANILQNIKHNE